MKRHLFLLFLLALGLTAHAQDTIKGFTQNVKISLAPLFYDISPVLTYEYMFPSRVSVEGEVGMQNLLHDDDLLYQGFVCMGGVKYYLPIRAVDRELVKDGYLPHRSFYIKGRLSYLNMSATYDCYVGNNGWEILTEERTYRQQEMALVFIIGQQKTLSEGFTIDSFIGFGRILFSNGRLRNLDYADLYPSASYTVSMGLCFTAGIKIGWAF